MATVTDAALDFALANVNSFTDSDFFPKPFEYRALKTSWVEVKNHLSSIDVKSQRVFRPRLAASPKPNGTFRVVHQLDPLNHLVYTAAAYMLAPAIEAARPPVTDKIACSYRLNVDATKGSFFVNNNGYHIFLDRCRELAGTHRYVLVTDITDYYNQINLHRLGNAIAHCAPNQQELGEELEEFLMLLNDKNSKGIPVGPPASIILAEANLIDVDEHIRAQGVVHTRYVDDFRIFADSEVALHIVLQNLTAYLYDNHRLILSSSKTRVLDTQSFIETYLDSPEVLETRALHQKLEEFWASLDPYETGPREEDVEPGDPDESELRTAALLALMEEVCSRPQLDLGLARHILRKSRKYRLRAIIPLLLQRFDFFAPVVSDVIVYLDRVASPAVLAAQREQLLALLNTKSASYRHVRFWLEHFFSLKYPHIRTPEVEQFLNGGALANQAVAALRTRSVAWVRNQKASFDNLGRWDRREVMHAAAVLPRVERLKWIERVEQSTSDFLEKMVAKWVVGFTT